MATGIWFFIWILSSVVQNVSGLYTAKSKVSRFSLASDSQSEKVVGSRFIAQYEELKISTLHGISLTDITSEIRSLLQRSGVQEGVVSVLSRHTTSAITINEMEGRLVDDTRQFLMKIAPAAYPYLHNDLHLRKGPGMFNWVQFYWCSDCCSHQTLFAAGWPGGDEAWRAQEPINAHSHLLAMILGTSEAIPVHKGELKIGQW